MGKIYELGGKKIDVDDRDAIKALSDEEFAELFRLALRTPSLPDDTGPALPVRQPPAGTGLVSLNPPTNEADDA